MFLFDLRKSNLIDDGQLIKCINLTDVKHFEFSFDNHDDLVLNFTFKDNTNETMRVVLEEDQRNCLEVLSKLGFKQ